MTEALNHEKAWTEQTKCGDSGGAPCTLTLTPLMRQPLVALAVCSVCKAEWHTTVPKARQ